MSKIQIQGVRGFPDRFPAETQYWHRVEKALLGRMQAHGYEEVRLPLVEASSLFTRGLGESTDVVSKEMYVFPDRHGESLCLRPEGTAGVVRAALQGGHLYHQTQKWWYYGPMFRYERPQKGRYRQFYQWGLEIFGVSSPMAEVELLLLCSELWKELGLESLLTLEINSLGTAHSRALYREALLSYFQSHTSLFSAEEQERLVRNPLRLLDSKNPALKDCIAGAPRIMDYLDPQSKDYFSTVLSMLTALQIPYTLNPALVRGLDYYSHTAFEWTTQALGAQGSVCGGGRYDGLIDLLGGTGGSGVGLGFGMDRLVALCMDQDHQPTSTSVDLVFLLLDDLSHTARAALFQLAQELRAQDPLRSIRVDLQGGGLKAQLKRAHTMRAQCVGILGAEEWSQQSITLKWLYRDQEQISLPLSEITSYIRNNPSWCI